MQEYFVRFGEYRLAGVLHSPDEKTSACIITCHGLYSSKDSEKYVDIGRRFCGEGLAVLRFDFRGCGESGGLFEDTSLTGRIEDLESALDFVEEQGYESIGVMGSSLGGTVAVLTAAKDKRVKVLVTWATPCHLDELFREGLLEGFEKLRQDVGRYDVVKALKETRCPILIVHGSLDEIVPLSHAKVLYENAKEPKNIQIVEGANHRLTDPFHRGRAVELTLGWFKKYLK